MTSSVLSVDSLSMVFGGLVAVDDVSFDVGEGLITAIIGPNGVKNSLSPVGVNMADTADSRHAAAHHTRYGLILNFLETPCLLSRRAFGEGSMAVCQHRKMTCG